MFLHHNNYAYSGSDIVIPCSDTALHNISTDFPVKCTGVRPIC